MQVLDPVPVLSYTTVDLAFPLNIYMNKTYTQRWFELAVKLIAQKGQIYALGYLTGILARHTRNDWALRAELERQEHAHRNHNGSLD